MGVRRAVRKAVRGAARGAVVRGGVVRGAVVAGAVAVTAVALSAGAAAAAGGPAAVAARGPAAVAGVGPAAEVEADVAYHGRVSLTGGRLAVLLIPENEGPAAVPAATLRLRLSADLAAEQALAEGCARSGPRVVVCETGALPLHGQGRHIALVLRLKERPSEVTVRVDTWWNGGATDRNLANNEHAVLALDTGDIYAF
ncbi:hypothetical protein [Streptomyces sp. NPDC089799]|uniref:hypothetical protein n=1 Tax=Streptomyces sp. NPDC089799 TaxID=3155066 RepID=UPI00342BDCD0